MLEATVSQGVGTGAEPGMKGFGGHPNLLAQIQGGE